MKFTIPGKDVIRVTENDYVENLLVDSDDKIHLIKLDFDEPTSEKIEWVLNKYPYTNRFIIVKHIRIYNNYLKKTNKKYYIENVINEPIISFFKKNNKVLLNFFSLDSHSIKFIIDHCFDDVLFNTEVIYISKEIYDKKKQIIDLWKGNVIIQNEYRL